MPERFRFAVKVPKAITHEARLAGCDSTIAAFAGQIANLGEKCGPLLVQLPPSLAFDPRIAAAFFVAMSRAVGPAAIVCEPRHASWFAPAADRLLADHRVARVVADPAPVPGADMPGGWHGLTYSRLHGSPRMYWSRYDDAAIEHVADAARAAKGESWTIFDNTASGAAIENALEMLTLSR